MNNFLESKKVRAVLWILGGLIILFIVFGLGIVVGYDRAGFAAGFNNNYFRIFYGAQPGGPVGLMTPPMPVAMHGVVGTVIDLGTSTISVKDQKDNEQSVAVSSGTVIRSGASDVTIGSVAIGDQIAVIGEPNNEGQIVARFIRIFSSASSTPN
ncbi:MAG TPA: hypothetical protein VMR99_01040 [Candidatus Paceibacterota bacterium]|nr:hypothetical protein [Candidatus Paceibacterota bacterium]